MQYAIIYISILLVFCSLDAIWLTSMASVLYKPTLGDILLSTPRLAPLIVFYLMYPAALVIFAGVPALKSGHVMPALVYGALFGGLAYATYDLTNMATLRNWTLQLSIIDVCWGAVASAAASAIGYMITAKVSGWFA